MTWRSFYNDQIKQSEAWLGCIALLLKSNNSTSKYNLYFRDNTKQLTRLQNEIEAYQSNVRNVLDQGNGYEINIYDAVCARGERLEDKCKGLETLSHEDYRLKRTFPIKNWHPLKTQHDRDSKHYELFKASDQTGCKIKIVSRSNPLASMHNALIDAFEQIHDLDYLDLSDNQLDDSVMKILQDAIQQRQGYDKIKLAQCEVLILSKNTFSAEGLRTLLQSISSKENVFIRHVLLDENHIDFDDQQLETVFLPSIKASQLISLDLTMNFIPKGYMPLKEGEKHIRLYYPKSRMEEELALDSKKEKRTFIKDTFANPKNCLCSLNAISAGSVSSILSKQNGKQKAISWQKGAIGLFANKANAWQKEHAYLVVEGISKFGQRYLVRGDLHRVTNANDNRDGIEIMVCQCSPKDFFNFTGNGEKALCRVGLFNRSEVKTVLKTMCDSHLKEDFLKYNRVSASGHNGTNCLKWAIDMVNSPTEGNKKIFDESWHGIPSYTI